MGYENGIPSNKNSNLPPYPGEYGVKAEHDVPAATKMGASFTHVDGPPSKWHSTTALNLLPALRRRQTL